MLLGLWGPHAALLGVARNTVSEWLSDIPSVGPDNGNKTDHRKKLTEADDAEIAERLDVGEMESRGPSPVVLPRDDIS